MFSFFKNASQNVIYSIGAGFNWILNNKKAIAMLALVVIARAENTLKNNRRVVVTYDCGDFEVIKLAIPIADLVDKPFSFGAKFDGDTTYRDCFVSSHSTTYCKAPPAWR